VKAYSASIGVYLMLLLQSSAVSGRAQQSAIPPKAPHFLTHFSLLAPGVGWAMYPDALYWTSNDGRDWRDITPPYLLPDASMAGAYFFDPVNGYVSILTHSDSGPEHLAIASTRDGGASWKLVPVDTPEEPSLAPTAHSPYAQSISFGDKDHGWIMLNNGSAIAEHSGSLIATTDAGSHWNHLPEPPVSGEIAFSSATDGILVTMYNLTKDRPKGSDVWFTRDGGRSWAPTVLPLPKDCPKCVAEYPGLPMIVDQSTAMIWSNLREDPNASRENQRVTSAEFISTDAGATWKLSRRAPFENPVWGAVAPARQRYIYFTVVPERSMQVPKSLLVQLDGISTTLPLPPGFAAGMTQNVAAAPNQTVGWILYGFIEPHPSELLSVDTNAGTTKVITPGPSNVTRPAAQTVERPSNINR
jgi:hypothetical protein